jgi:hypothetical protein
VTVAEQRCERTDLPASMCSHCRGHDEPPLRPDDLPAPSLWIEAQYRSACPACHHTTIRPGDRIARCGEDWVCETCGEGATG